GLAHARFGRGPPSRADYTSEVLHQVHTRPGPHEVPRPYQWHEDAPRARPCNSLLLDVRDGGRAPGRLLAAQLLPEPGPTLPRPTARCAAGRGLGNRPRPRPAHGRDALAAARRPTRRASARAPGRLAADVVRRRNRHARRRCDAAGARELLARRLVAGRIARGRRAQPDEEDEKRDVRDRPAARTARW